MNDLLATPHVCIGKNVLASDVNTRDLAKVRVNENDVTKDIKENGQGVDILSGDSIEIQFSDEQTIDSVVVLPKSNVESYYVSYETADGYEVTLVEVSPSLPLEKKQDDYHIGCFIRINKIQKRKSIEFERKNLSSEQDRN